MLHFVYVLRIIIISMIAFIVPENGAHVHLKFEYIVHI